MRDLSSTPTHDSEIALIIGNSNSNFSGVTSTMLQVMARQQPLVNLRIMGKHFVDDAQLVMSFWQVAKLCRQPLKNGKWRVFHARRVDEMIQGVLLKYVFRAKLKLVFSSAAQRKRSASTKWLTDRMDAVIAISNRSAQCLHTPPAMVSPHGIQIEKYRPASDKRAAWQALGFGGQYGIGILGRVRKQKGVHLFIEACIQVLPHCPDVNAVVVGAISNSNQEFVQSLTDKIAAAGLSERITFTGELPFEQIPPIFSALSMVSALSDNEGFGLTVLEAMSCEAAVLATQAGAWEEIIRQGTDGYVVPVNDQAAITEKMSLMLSDMHNLAEMGKAGRLRVEDHYRVEDEAKRLVEFFDSLT